MGMTTAQEEKMNNILKTDKMRLLEMHHHEDIRTLISVKRGSIRKVASDLGLNHSTISRWRKYLLVE